MPGGRLAGALRLGLALAACLAVVVLTQLWAEQLFLEQTRTRAAAKLDLYASNLSGALGKYQSVPKLLALHSDVVELFQAPDDPAVRARANRLTETVNRLTGAEDRSDEHTSELQSLMRNPYAVFCLKKKRHNSQAHYW